MRQDASVECGTDEHKPITNLAKGFIVVWPIGSLVLYMSLLAACYKPLKKKTRTALTRATRFLHREYVLTYYWWEALTEVTKQKMRMSAAGMKSRRPRAASAYHDLSRGAGAARQR